jgi:hypothetical protein
MILSAEQLFSDDQAVTATAVSTNYIDLGAAGTPYGAAAAMSRDVGKGTIIPLLIQATAAATAAGAATVTFSIETDDNSSFSSATTVATTPAIGKAELVAGYRAVLNIVPEKLERYVQIRYTVATGPLTAGAFTAGITMGNQTND